MAASAISKWQYAQQVEREFLSELKNKEQAPSFERIDSLIHELRINCEAIIFLDFSFASHQGVETRLWNAHSQIKDRYKAIVSNLREKDPKKHVEKRKIEKRYADFIKTTQFFYKGYIQRLASFFTGMKDLRRIAHRLSLDTLSVEKLVKPSPEVERLISSSCHATLLRLGDLSRYRNEFRTKDRSWAPALGYYALASNLCPDSGSSHNQMAVIALADRNHLDAVYYLYRAIAVKEPYELAKGNLELNFKKITNAWEKKSAPPMQTGDEGTLIVWFVRLHAKFYKGDEFPTHDELEKEVLVRIGRLLKEQSFGSTLEKIVLINIAAEYLAAERVREQAASADTCSSFYFLLRFNVRMFLVLLQGFKPNVEKTETGEDLRSGSDESQSDGSHGKITQMACRILPALRQYSTWLTTRFGMLVNPVSTYSVHVYATEMWRLYADVMTRTVAYFSVTDLPGVEYLLEEDETTIGFKPLQAFGDEAEINYYKNDDGILKPRSNDPGVQRSPGDVEMQARVRDIVLCALSLQKKANSPIFLTHERTFAYLEDATNHTALESTQTAHVDSLRAKEQLRTESPGHQRISDASCDETTSISDAQQNMDDEMLRMVDNLVDPSSTRNSENNETSYGMHSRTANEIFAPSGSQRHSHQHSTPKVLPSLPSIWASPFTPQVNELKPTSPERYGGAHQAASYRYSTTEEQHAAALALDNITGYSPSSDSPWSRKGSGHMSAGSARPVNEMLQESLSKQFMQGGNSLSQFTAPSSLYGNTPRAQEYQGGFPNNALTTRDNNSTTYAGASDFDVATMVRSSLWDGSQPATGYFYTPPGGQGG